MPMLKPSGRLTVLLPLCLMALPSPSLAVKDCTRVEPVAKQRECLNANINSLTKQIARKARESCEARYSARGDQGSALMLHASICVEQRLQEIVKDIK